MSKDVTLERDEEKRKRQKLSCVKQAICPDHPRRRSPLKFCMRGCVFDAVIYFMFHENPPRARAIFWGRGSKIAFSHWLGPYGLYNRIYYRTSRASYLPSTAVAYKLCRYKKRASVWWFLCFVSRVSWRLSLRLSLGDVIVETVSLNADEQVYLARRQKLTKQF